jgi:hypothetical protein
VRAHLHGIAPRQLTPTDVDIGPRWHLVRPAGFQDNWRTQPCRRLGRGIAELLSRGRNLIGFDGLMPPDDEWFSTRSKHKAVTISRFAASGLPDANSYLARWYPRRSLRSFGPSGYVFLEISVGGCHMDRAYVILALGVLVCFMSVITTLVGTHSCR